MYVFIYIYIYIYIYINIPVPTIKPYSQTRRLGNVRAYIKF